MTQKKQYEEMTNAAWSRLAERLIEDRPAGESPKGKRPVEIRKISKLQIAVAAILIGVVVSAALWYAGYRADHRDMRIVFNEGTSPLATPLADGSIVYIAERGSLEFPDEFPKNRRQVVLHGDAYFDVTGNADQPFLIETKQFTIEVVGTSFLVKSNPELPFELSVVSGEVRVTDKQSQQVYPVKAGEQALFENLTFRVHTLADREAIRDYKHVIHFKDESIENVCYVLNQNLSGQQLSFAEGVKDLPVSFGFDNTASPEHAAFLICTLHKLNYKIEGDTILIY